MKRVTTIITAMFFCTIIFTGCTDDTEQLSETAPNERGFEIQLVDPDDEGSAEEGEEEGD